MNNIKNIYPIYFLGIILLLILTSCSPAPAATPTATLPLDPPLDLPADTPEPSITPTPVIAYAAFVNGEGIRTDSLNASLFQFTQALESYPELLADGQTPEEKVLDELINRALLAQAARESGFTADVQLTVEHLAKLIEQAGGNEAFGAWLTESGYTLESFSLELPLELEAAWQRDQIAATVPSEMEQVKAQQILFYDPFLASRAYDQLNAGLPFETISQNNDPDQLGYLDWFPPGVLLFPELEAVLFSLQPGQYSEVIETAAGYHILYVFEKGVRSLSTETRLLLEEQAVSDWLETQRSLAQIQILLP